MIQATLSNQIGAIIFLGLLFFGAVYVVYAIINIVYGVVTFLKRK